MRIAYLARRRVPSRNANAVQIMKMCEAFARIGHEVRLFALPGDRDCSFERYGVEPVFGIDHLPRRRGRAPKLRFLIELFPRLRAFRPEVFYGRDIVSLAIVSLLRKPVIFEAHGVPEERSARAVILAWMFGRRSFSHLVCTTSTIADGFRDRFPSLAGKPIMIAPNAATRRPASTNCTAGALPGRPGHAQVGFIGRPFPGKGIEAMIDAARILPAIDFHVVGAERDEVEWVDGPIPGNLYFHGYHPHGALDRFYRHFDIAAAPYGRRVMNASGRESAAMTSPLKLLEYLAAGLPTIVSDLPGVRDVIGSSPAVTLVEPGDHRQFAEAVRILAGDSALRQRMADAGRALHAGQHTTVARANKVLAALRGNCGGSSPNRVGEQIA